MEDPLRLKFFGHAEQKRESNLKGEATRENRYENPDPLYCGRMAS